MGNQLLNLGQYLCVIFPAHHTAAIVFVGQVQSQPFSLFV